MWMSWSRRQGDDPGPEEVSSGNVLIYDMGGDTFGASLDDEGDAHLGTEDVDNEIVDVRMQVSKGKNRGKGSGCWKSYCLSSC